MPINEILKIEKLKEKTGVLSLWDLTQSLGRQCQK